MPDLVGVDGLDGAVIADVRWYLDDPEGGVAAYRTAHIPGAVYVHLERDLSAEVGPGRHPLPTRAAFASAIGGLGFGSDDRIVVYDDRGGAVASRMWWMLRDIGHDAVSVLDGGLQAWEEEGGPLESGHVVRDPAVMKIGPSSTRTIERDELNARRGSLTVYDARDPERFRGELEPIDPVAGHVPGAANRPYLDNLDADGRFLDGPALADRYRSDRDVVVYCGSGVTACHDILAIRLAGLPEPMLYPGSWSDWSTTGLPVEVGNS